MVDDALLAALDELEQRLMAVEDPILDMLQPGIGEDEVSSALAAQGLHPPAELVTWWGWHNGSRPPNRLTSFASIGFPYSVQDALTALVSWRDNWAVDAVSIFQDAGIDRALDWFWRPSWLPLFGLAHSGVIAADTAGSGSAPLHDVEAEDVEGTFHEPSTPSIAVAIRTAVEAIDENALRWNRERKLWVTGENWINWPIERRSRLL